MAQTPSEKYAQIVADVFKEAREGAGLSQKKLAEVSGVGRTGIINLEAAKRNPSILICQMLADGLKIPFSTLVADIEERRSKSKR